MIKKLIFLLAAVGMITNISGCTSKKAQDESEIVENAAVDKIDAESQALSGTPGDPINTATDDASLQAALGEAAPVAIDPAIPVENLTLDGAATAATEPVTTSPDIAAAPTLDETSLNDIPAPADANVAGLTETPLTSDAPLVGDTPVVSEAPAAIEVSPEPVASAPSSSSFASGSSFSDSSSSPKPAGSSLKKVSSTVPYQSGTGFVNTVYVARPGEKLKAISQKIFGTDKSRDLKKIAENSFLKSRSVKAGDKIYYVSPNRAEDSTKMLLYYEDMGMVPETYVAKKGDKLKKVAKEILGYDKAWVELWTSNSVDSKDKLAEGETLRYWRSTSSIANTTSVAQNTPPPQDTGAAQLIDPAQMPANPPPPDANQNVAANSAPPPQDMNSLPPPPDMPAPPPADPAVAAAAATPPPPPDMNVPPPPPPPDMAQPAAKAKKKFAPGEEESTSMVEGIDQDTLMSLGAVGFLTVALAFVLIRRRKKRASEQGMTEHNVGT